ncbi:MAG: nucleotidyltransferase domain-containing protein [Candidatus Nanoarchaeia archaeon]|nr:nucleotidyltransferase domain-containing protein [Candidatus Haiyanarchaeum thermophilum]MCW1302856.1 nucleotidyltransferase domain-containing protein [Candidatus Haiyanarchaeum thermophilum]MCW1307328.1 nucleotidyltransferase domain-containing protein [Candidatus Haiyanarchaeum thermophilum]MCW1307944.1 nucleotidyltransferase domain-containing protein [Candidatus Haiyanarchaeum thermophilum]
MEEEKTEIGGKTPEKFEKNSKKGRNLKKEEKSLGFPGNLAGVTQLTQAIVERRPVTVGDFLTRRELRYVEIYTASILEKFKHYIKAVVIWGSSRTGIGKRKSSDIDVAVIVDDTDVQRMSRPELKERLFQHLYERARPISKRIHPQPYLLSEFLEYVREGNPVICNILRDGLPVYDVGFFLPLQRSLISGNIRPTKECIDKHMSIAFDLLDLVENVVTEKLTYDLEQAIVSSAQAVLMELGYRPPAPNEVVSFLREFMLPRKLIDEELVGIAEEIISLYKSVEHRERKRVSGREIEEYFTKAKKFVEDMSRILRELRKARGESFEFEMVEKARKFDELRRDGMIRVEKKEELEEKREKLIKEGLGQR